MKPIWHKLASLAHSSFSSLMQSLLPKDTLLRTYCTALYPLRPNMHLTCCVHRSHYGVVNKSVVPGSIHGSSSYTDEFFFVFVDLLFIVTPIVGVYNCSMFCCTLLYFHSSILIILMGKRELVALLNLSSWCLMMVEWLFLVVP